MFNAEFKSYFLFLNVSGIYFSYFGIKSSEQLNALSLIGKVLSNFLSILLFIKSGL
jgi:hypothetical protein